jgi:hypothetical protein
VAVNKGLPETAARMALNTDIPCLAAAAMQLRICRYYLLQKAKIAGYLVWVTNVIGYP